MKEIIKKHTGIILAFVVMLALLPVIAIFGGTIMKLFGFEYDSISCIIIFFIISEILSFPLEMIAKGLPILQQSFVPVCVAGHDPACPQGVWGFFLDDYYG